MHLISGERAKTEDGWRYSGHAKPDIGYLKFHHVDVIFHRCLERKFDIRPNISSFKLSAVDCFNSNENPVTWRSRVIFIIYLSIYLFSKFEQKKSGDIEDGISFNEGRDPTIPLG